ncbi:MAG TPA: type II toxin-antitoxin system HicB family antitoxin [archaeon]|nr:type II toxin-antitoxin system HicB family antitoxin [archaeon]
MRRVVEVSSRQILVFVYKSEKYFVAEYPFLEIATQGRTEEEALHNIQEAVEIHLKLRGDEIRLPQSEHIASINISLPA